MTGNVLYYIGFSTFLPLGDFISLFLSSSFSLLSSMQSLASVAMTVDRKIVLVTGAAAGIGLEAVKALLSSEHASYEILLSARKLTQAQAASEQVAAGYPSSSSGVVPLELDVESDESIEAAANHVKANYGRLDALINNAGLLTCLSYTALNIFLFFFFF